MAHSPHPKHTPGRWQHLIEQQTTSGLSQEAFCASQGLGQGHLSVLEAAPAPWGAD